MNTPKHWKVMPLRQLVIAQKGKKPIKLSESKFPDSVPYLDIEAVEKGKINQYADPYSTVLATKEDIFVVADGYRSGLVAKGMVGAVGSTIISLKPLVINSVYLFHFLNSKFEYLNKNTTGGSVLHLNQELFYDLEVPVPPLKEQENIVAELESKLSAYQNEFKDAESELSKVVDYRKSILEQAVTGQLTKSWRGRLGSETNKGGLPSSWKNTNIDTLTIFIGSGSTPNGGASNYLDSGVTFIRSQNVYPDELRLDDVAYISEAIHEQMQRSQLKPKDVLLNITGASIGRVAVVPDNFGEGNVNQHVCILRVYEDLILPNYLSLFLNSPIGHDQIMALQSGVTRQGLNYTQIRSIKISLPPISEQNEIIKQVTQHFNQIKLLETEQVEKINKINKLLQSILQMAFTGYITPSITDNTQIDLIKQVESARAKKLLELKQIKMQQSTLKPKNLINFKDSNKVKDYIKTYTKSEFSENSEPITSKEVRQIFNYIRSKFNGFDYDDFSALFLELAQDKINPNDDEPFFVAVRLDGKIGFQIRNS